MSYLLNQAESTIRNTTETSISGHQENLAEKEPAVFSDLRTKMKALWGRNSGLHREEWPNGTWQGVQPMNQPGRRGDFMEISGFIGQIKGGER